MRDFQFHESSDMRRIINNLVPSTDKQSTAISCDGLHIFIKFLPVPPKMDPAEKCLVTSLNIRRRDGVTEYHLTLLENQTHPISTDQIRKVIRQAHDRGLYKTCQKIVSFIEYDDSDNLPLDTDANPNVPGVTHRFNFII